MERIPTILVVFACTLCGSRALAGAAVTAIETFVGDFSEGFEAFRLGEIPGRAPNVAGPVSILAGHATLSGVHSRYPVNPFFVWDSFGGFSLDDLTEAEGNVRAIPFDGTRGLSLQTVLTENPVARIDFATPAVEFGGYWVHAVTRTIGGPITLSMFSADGGTIDTIEFHYDYAGLQGISQWFGWSSTVPIHAITFTGPWAGVDGIQINVIPEPSAGAMVVIAAVVLIAVSLRICGA